MTYRSKEAELEHIRKMQAREREQQHEYATRKYGLSLQKKREMYAAQGGKCANIGCDTLLPALSRAHIDHCHKTGKVRGLLCVSCNAALGLLRDDTRRIVGLLDYLGAINLRKLTK